MKNKITKKSTVRDVLQILGTDLLRKGFNENIHVAATLGAIKKDEKVIITDTRFENELEAVKKRGGITIRVNRPGLTKSNHLSETSLDSATFDFIINNDKDIKHLINEVRNILIENNLIKVN